MIHFNKFLVVLAVIILPMSLMAIGADAGVQLYSGGDGNTANQADTPGDILISYSDLAGSDYDTTSPTAAVDTTINQIYGDTLTVNNNYLTVSQNDTVYFTLQIENTGNGSDSFTLSSAGLASGDSGQVMACDSYAIGFINDENNDGTRDANDSALITGTSLISEGAFQYVYIAAYLETTGLNVGGTAVVTVKARGDVGATGFYTGNNGTVYGGDGNDSVTISFESAGAAIYVAKYSYCTSPVDYQTLGGAANAAVPGSTITYEICYDNDGSDSALNMQIIDYFPANTTFGKNGSLSFGSIDTSAIHTSGLVSTIEVFAGEWVDIYNYTGDTATMIKFNFANRTDNYGAVSNTNGDGTGACDVGTDIDKGIIRIQLTIN